MEKGVKTLMFLKCLEDHPKMRKTEVEYVDSTRRTGLQTYRSALSCSFPGCFEIDAVAVLQGARMGVT